jgi:uncharacterized HAD superfamily protein
MENQRNNLKVILVDLDGVLCKGDTWNPEDCLKAKPIEKNIEEVNRLHQKHFVVIYTSRRDNLIPATLEWLRRNNVQYQAFSNKKSAADIYIDDRSINPEDMEDL